MVIPTLLQASMIVIPGFIEKVKSFILTEITGKYLSNLTVLNPLI
jgi:hypothetical protein